MTLYRNIIQSTRPLLLATATGVAMCSFTVIAEAQQQLPGTTGSVRSATPAEPRLLPLFQQSLLKPFDSAVPLSHTEGQPSAAGNLHRATGPHSAGAVTHPVANNRSSSDDSQRSGFSERIGRLFKGKPTTPPVDPGMSYPKASDVSVTPPQAPGAAAGAIPSIPPSYGSVTPQPGLFQAPSSVNAIGASEIPPVPGQQQIAGNNISSPAMQEIPALPEIPGLADLESNHVAAENSSRTAQNNNLPNIDLDVPMPGNQSQIAPGEPSDHPLMTAQSPKSNDPFADLFPEDRQSASQENVAADQKLAPTPPPYTGLSLDDESALTQVEMLPPPPRVEGVNVDKPVDIIVEKKSETKTASAAPLSLPPVEMITTTSPGKNAGTSQLTSANSSGIEIKPGTTTPKLTPIIAPTSMTPSSPPASSDQRAKMDRITARSGLKGLKGFCPVVLRDDRNLVDSSSEYSVTHLGREYTLSSAEARAKFLDDPSKYAPASACCDVIHLALTGEQLEGSLEHAVWYKGRLYLFAGIETMETFVAAPSSHATDE